MRDQELILRFLALYYDADKYSRPMKGFLNTFMGRNKHLTAISTEEMRSVFNATVQIVSKSIGKRAFKLARVLNAAVFDAVMVGIARRLRLGAITDLETLRTRYAGLLENARFLAATGRATADEESVAIRLDLATRAFTDVP